MVGVTQQRNPRRRITCEKRGERRLLCSDLVRVSWMEAEIRYSEVAVLENLSLAGVGLFTGVPVPEHAPIQIASKRGVLTGVVKNCGFRENGYVIGVELDAESMWAQQPGSGFAQEPLLPGRLVPEHLIDISLLDLD